MYLLDSDHMSLLERGGAEGVNIRSRLRAIAPDDVATTIIFKATGTRQCMNPYVPYNGASCPAYTQNRNLTKV